MRRANENQILHLLRREGALPGSVISRKTQLAPQTVSVLLRRLEDEGLIQKGQALRGRRGQPAVPISLRPDGAYAIGVEFGWQHYDWVLMDLSGGTVMSGKRFYPWPQGETAVEDIAKGVERLLSRLPSNNPNILGIGMTGPNKMQDRAFILGAPPEDAHKLVAEDIMEGLSARLDLPVTFFNDGVSALWAESVNGRIPSVKDSGYVFLSTFIAAALNVDGHVLRGSDDSAGRIGTAMSRRREDGQILSLHRVGSLYIFEQLLREENAKPDAANPLDWDWDALEHLFARWLEQAVPAYALAIGNTSAIMGISSFVLDGLLPRPILARLINAVQAEINALPIEIFDPPTVLLGTAGPSAPAIGAAYQLIYDRYFSE